MHIKEQQMKKLSLLLFAALLVSASAHAQVSPVVTDSKFPLFQTKESAQHRCPFDVVVWLDTKSDVYSVGGPPADNQDPGAYMCQREADQMDYHNSPGPAAK
jgi:hypothetical protein